ncbi:MAG: UDP-N-acetylglucosamine 2-epimerase (non-hydrolyzing) [Methylococcales bacterium]
MTDNRSPKNLMIVIGTRPEAIKLAPIVLGALERPDLFVTQIVVTGQHREMLDQMLRQFGIEPDLDLDIMKQDQNLCHVTNAALDGLYKAIASLNPDCVIVQGDTTTTFAGALAAFYQHVPVAHVEAGLRTFDKQQPWPEEVNRCLTSQLADFHFPPTQLSRENLQKEGVSAERIWVTGNTAIDALLHTLKRVGQKSKTSHSTKDTRQILLTAHRRENHGVPMESICRAVRRLLDEDDTLELLYPVHKSPRVREVVYRDLGDHPRIQLVEPMEYEAFVIAMNESTLILTDSGGIQEEAPSLGKPVLVLRETTERPEAIEAGVAKLIGTDSERIYQEARKLLYDDAAYQSMARAVNPYGDGSAANQVLDILAAEL